MARPRKVAKLKINWLDQLPDHILQKIVSVLPLEEAVRTSVVSKNWNPIWLAHPNISFCAENVFAQTKFLKEPLVKWKFVQIVDQFMAQRSKGGPISSFALHFPLDHECSSHNIRRWIDCALRLGAESIDLSFSGVDVKHKDLLEVDWSILGKKSKLKDLKLESCSFGGATSLSSMVVTSLTDVALKNVCISDQQLQNLILNCALLEKLSLRKCNSFVSLDVSCSRLKALEIHNCQGLRKLDVTCARNLVTFEYIGSFLDLSFRNVPKMSRAFLHFTEKETRIQGLTYALTAFPRCIPQLETLNISASLTMQALELPHLERPFLNVKELVVTIMPFYDEDNLSWLLYILRTFPSLQKLRLNLIPKGYVRVDRPGGARTKRVMPADWQHVNIQQVAIHGYSYDEHELELMEYLGRNLTELKLVEVSPCHRRYRGLEDWIYDEECPRIEAWKSFFPDNLSAIFPSTVKLQIDDSLSQDM